MFIREKILQNRILEDKNLRIRGDVATQLNCLYRNINIYTYMAYLDVDEVLMCRLIQICLLHVFEIKNVSFSQVIMPRIHKDWYEMVNQLEDASHGKVFEKNTCLAFMILAFFEISRLLLST